MASRAVLAAIERRLGGRVSRCRAVGGGDVARAEELLLADGRALFLKTREDAPPTMFAREADGLALLAAPEALRVPEVLACSGADEPGYLALELVRPAPIASDFDDRLGRGLAALHRATLASFGLPHDNFLATIAQSNAPSVDWPSFYRDRRLAPLVESARDRGLLPRRMLDDFDRLFARIDELARTSEPPARLHGDLWSGNVIVDERGEPCLVDPAVYGGQREIDLAMIKLFGGFGPRVFDAYREAWPLEPAAEGRVSLYQLYPLLAHVALFGASYVPSVERALGAALR